MNLVPFYFVAQAQAAPAPNGMSSMLIPMVCIGAIFYFMIIRPQSKRQKELESLVSSLKTGDKVVTNSGIHGIISNVKEGKTLMLKVDNNVKIEIDKAAIASVEKSGDSTPAVLPA